MVNGERNKTLSVINYTLFGRIVFVNCYKGFYDLIRFYDFNDFNDFNGF